MNPKKNKTLKNIWFFNTMKKSISIIGMIAGGIIMIYGFIKSKGNLDNFRNINFYIYIIGLAILLISFWKYPDPDKFFGVTKSQDKQGERVLTPSSSPPVNNPIKFSKGVK